MASTVLLSASIALGPNVSWLAGERMQAAPPPPTSTPPTNERAPAIPLDEMGPMEDRADAEGGATPPASSAATPDPLPTSTPPPSPPPNGTPPPPRTAPPPPGGPDDAHDGAARKGVAIGFAVTGGVFGIGGLCGLVFVSAPFAIAGQVADDRADKPNNFGASDSELRSRADKRRDIARNSAIVSGYIVAGGAAFGIVALSVWPWGSRRIANANPRRLRLAPSPSDHPMGLTLSGRF